ncbi:DNA-processing protein DprA [Mailhella massiliensis]|uniref:DNA-processing protein DprA n=1 Tax=Mailhella massiliensis TaxID=1903261 RepID=A0A921AXH8_9BACT|nr:DNA-processing protein DprA [Mailhella massiliensis]HJD97664.1 DNA-processing protein DprA [Mailhella massiliensis]
MTATSALPSGLAALDDDGRREYWAALALRCTPGLGSRGACLLLRHFGSAYAAITSLSRWPEAGVPSHKAEELARNTWRARARPEWEASRRLDAAIILWTDPRYPALLKELPDAPALFYAKGELSLLAGPCVAVVGSRESSAAALDMASAMAGELSRAGVTVVSGLAFGVDGRAHRAALTGPGRTIAVMPGGVDRIFPARHRELYQRMAEHGLIVSEMPPGTTPGPGAFPVRNRIISGLSLGLLMVEAVHAGSGSLITARLAAEQGRNVYVPSPDICRGPYREGTKKLLLEGARPVFRASDILADLFPHLKSALDTEDSQSPLSHTRPAQAQESSGGKTAPALQDTSPIRSTMPGKAPLPKEKSSAQDMTEEEAYLLSLLREKPLLQDELLHAAQDGGREWTSASVSAALMILEVKHLARRLSDGRYEANA